MNTKSRIISVLFQTIDEINEQLLDNQKISKSINTILIGMDAELDSMSLVNLFIIAEDKLQKEFDVKISLIDEQTFSDDQLPFKTINEFADYITRLLID